MQHGINTLVLAGSCMQKWNMNKWILGNAKLRYVSFKWCKVTVLEVGAVLKFKESQVQTLIGVVQEAAPLVRNRLMAKGVLGIEKSVGADLN